MKSDKIEALTAALNKVQANLRGAVKDSVNPHFKHKFADLESVWESCRRELTDNGFAITQAVDMIDGTAVLVTTLMHVSGQWVQGRYPLIPVKNDPQSLGSAMTYARRYSLAAMVGVYSVDDDDGHHATHAPVSRRHEDVQRVTPETVGTLRSIQSIKVPVPPRDPMLPSSEEKKQTLGKGGEYVVTFGPLKGLALKTVPEQALAGMCQQILGKPSWGKAENDVLLAVTEMRGLKNLDQLRETLSNGTPY